MNRSIRLTCAFLLPVVFGLPVLTSPAYSATISYGKQLESASATRIRVANLAATSDNALWQLVAPDAEFSKRDNQPAPHHAVLPQGGKVTGAFGAVDLGPGEIWLPEMSWMGDVHSVVTLPKVPREGAIAVITSYSCSAKKTMIEITRGTPEDTGFVGASIETRDGTSVSLSCSSGQLRVSFDPPL